MLPVLYTSEPLEGTGIVRLACTEGRMGVIRRKEPGFSAFIERHGWKWDHTDSGNSVHAVADSSARP